MGSSWKNLNINMPALILEGLGNLMVLMALFLPNWLANPNGLNYYPYPRSWGLWYVTGRLAQTHSEQWQTQCKISASLSPDILNVSPLSKWYNAKCSANRMITYVSYTVGGLIILSMLFKLVGIVYSLRKQRKYTKWASLGSFLGFLLPVIALVLYFQFMSQAFEVINSHGYYPVPQPSAGIFVLAVGLFCWFCGFIAHVVRGRKIVKEANFEEDTFYDVQQIRQQHGMDERFL